MKSKTKNIEISGTRYQLSKMPPDVGSFILMRMIAAGVNSGGSQPDREIEESQAAKAEPSGEEMTRAVVFSAFLRGLDYETSSFIQKACLLTVSRIEGSDGQELPMRLMTDSGAWALHRVRDDIFLVMKLQIEALVFNLADFFDAGGLNALAGARASKE